MSALTPKLRAEIEHHLHARSIRHGIVFRDMERDLNAQQMACSQRTSVSNVRNLIRSVQHLLDGTLPTTKSLALTNSYVYRELLDRNPSPALRSYVTSCLRQLAAINPEIRVDEPLRPGTLHDAGTLAREAAATQKTACPTCHMVHAGECL